VRGIKPDPAIAQEHIMRIFIAGIMQGSRLDSDIADQSYRLAIAAAVRRGDPLAEIVDPNELHPEGASYDDVLARRTLFELLTEAARADLLIAYAPSASMGTAIEMWQAYQGGIPIVTISPMAANWIVRYLSAVVLPDLAAFDEWVSAGGLARLMAKHPPAEAGTPRLMPAGQFDNSPDLS
jgi:hypothetical protein